tara:strand:+ start:8771 stop:8938 length:168 start_codon:yes stop_codon:yes gene_type:complete
MLVLVAGAGAAGAMPVRAMAKYAVSMSILFSLDEVKNETFTTNTPQNGLANKQIG